MRALRHTAVIAGRELGALARTPVTLLVAVLFLAVQGFSFWAVLEVLGDPRRPAPYGAVLRTHYGGTFLYWTFVAFVAAALTMRLVAEERRTGTWETLCAAPVGDGAIVCGKWLGALGFYALLWAPTLLHPILLRVLAPPGAAPDAGPIFTAYLGVLVTGASFLAVGLAASAATANQLVAALVAFVSLLALLLSGFLPETAPSWFPPGGLAARVVDALDVRAHMDGFARGVVDSRHLAVHAALATTALVAAAMLAGAGRRPRGAARGAALGVVLVAVASLLVVVEAARHPLRLDATRARVYTLEPRTRQILADVQRPVRALVLAGDAPEFRPLYDEVFALLERFAAAQPLLEIERLDPALEPGRVGELAEAYRLTPEELTLGGAVVFLSGERHRGVGLLDMADFASEAAGGVMREFRGEEAFASAILEVTDEARPELCFTGDHGELPLEASPGGQDLAVVGRALSRDGVRLSRLGGLAGGVPAHCAALAIVGPRRPFSAGEAAAVDAWLRGGGRLWLAVDPDVPPGTEAIAPTGLETVLAGFGVRLGPAVVVDPEREIGIPLAWGTLDGYADDHPVTAGFQGRRDSYWFAPRLIAPVEAPGVDAQAIVASSPDGWGETRVASLRGGVARDDADVPGPAPVAVAATTDSGARVVAYGSARAFTSEVLDRGLGAGDRLAASTVAWLTGRDKLAGVGAKTPEQFRLVLTREKARRLFWLLVVIWPLCWGGAGLAWWWRRERAGRGRSEASA